MGLTDRLGGWHAPEDFGVLANGKLHGHGQCRRRTQVPGGLGYMRGQTSCFEGGTRVFCHIEHH